MLKSLGQSLGRVLNANLSGASALKGIDGRLTTPFGADSRIHLSQCGTWGDPGTVDSGWIFFQPEASIKRLLNNPSGPEKLLAARASWLGYRGTTIGPYGTLSQLTGLDHRTLLPPLLACGTWRRSSIWHHAAASSPRVCGSQRGLGRAPLPRRQSIISRNVVAG